MQPLEKKFLQCSLIINNLEKCVLDDKNIISSDLKIHILDIFKTSKWDISSFGYAIYRDERADFTPLLKLLTFKFGRISILCHLFRKAVFPKGSRYEPNADKAVNAYHSSGSLEAFNKMIIDLPMSANEKNYAQEFFLDFSIIEYEFPKVHYKVQSFEHIELETTLPLMLTDTVNEMTKMVKHHLFPYIAGFEKEHSGIPLFETLKAQFKVDSNQLLYFALKAYCQCAFRGLYTCKFSNKYQLQKMSERIIPVEESVIPNSKPNENIKKLQRWYKVWARASILPSFSEEFYIFLRALAPAIEMDFGFSAPHPNALVKIAMDAAEEVNALRQKELNKINDMKKYVFDYRSFRETLMEKLNALFNSGADIDALNYSETIDADGEELIEWFKDFSKSDLPLPFNLSVIRVFKSSLEDMKTEYEPINFHFDDLMNWTKNLIFVVKMMKRVALEKRIALEKEFNAFLHSFPDYIEGLYINQLPTKEHENHRLMDDYQALETWYLNWSKQNWTLYTYDALFILKKFSPLTEPLPERLLPLTPKELEFQLVKKIKEHLSIKSQRNPTIF